MKLEDLTAFITLVQLQSTRQTASALGLTQPAVTRRVQNFEESLGVQLLDRQTKPLKPTPLGLQVYQQCKRIAAEVDGLAELVAGDATPQGVLRCGLPHSLTDEGLLPVLAALQQRYPQVQPRLSSGWGNQLLQQLEHNQLDAALLLFPPGKIFSAGLQAQPLGAVPLVVVAADDGQPLPRTLAQCYSRGWILNPDGCGFRGTLTRALADRGLPLQLNMEVQGTALQLGLIGESAALGILPRMLLSRAARQHPVREVPLQDFSPQSELWLVHPAMVASQQGVVNLFASTLAASFGLNEHC